MLSSLEKEKIKEVVGNMEIEAERVAVSVIPSTILIEEIGSRLELSDLRLSAIKQALELQKSKEITVI